MRKLRPRDVSNLLMLKKEKRSLNLPCHRDSMAELGFETNQSGFSVSPERVDCDKPTD